MKLLIFDSYETQSQAVADAILSQVARKPESVLCLATGDSPLRTYQLLVEKAKAVRMDFSMTHFVALDEWVGIPPDNSGSCKYFLTKNLFGPLAISSDRIHLFDALTSDIKSECAAMDDIIQDLGGIDLMLVGIGINGHVGFNEPGVSTELYSHVIQLDEVTQKVGQKYFKERVEIKEGITLGFQHIRQTKMVLLIANGSKKAEIITKMLEGEITSDCPASILRKHSNSYVYLDSLAATNLS